jgi:succinoglycan biosynthesis protein ExoA
MGVERERANDSRPARASARTAIERVSIVAPMLNEAAHVESFVADVAAQDVDLPLELLVADGGSEDGSVDLLEAAAAKAGVAVTVIANPARHVSAGLNACIERATGDLIVRMDCHSRYPADYVRLCVNAAEETGAWNVGGVVVAEGATPAEEAVAAAMSSPFGGIGWTRSAAGGERHETDTVTFGAFRPIAFEEAGLFDETLVRNQDDEFNLRLRRAGGTIVLDPAIVVRYRPRGSLRAVFRQYFEYGYWKVPVMRKHGRVLTIRSLAPAAFVVSLAALGAAAPPSRAARALLGLEVGTYVIASLVAAAAVSPREGRRSGLLRTAAVFPAFHLGYGTGMVVALVRRP